MNLMAANTPGRQKEDGGFSAFGHDPSLTLSHLPPYPHPPLFFPPTMSVIIKGKCLLQGVPPEKLAGNKNAQNLMGSSS